MLEFRVMRLSPHLSTHLPLRLALAEQQRELADFSQRSHLHEALDVCGVDAALEMPQQFGLVSLGEAFSAHVSVANPAQQPVSLVGIKAEVQTDRQKSVLFDNTESPLRSLSSGCRFDFTVKHDVKELGAHTLAATALYSTIDGERKVSTQIFKFSSSSTLSVRTKTRHVGETTLLEACIENTSRSILFLNYVRFEPAPLLTSNPLPARPESVPEEQSAGEVLSNYISQLHLIRSNGSINFLFASHRLAAPGLGGAGGSSLGKLSITWLSPMGQVGRLQTQQILSSAASAREIEISVISLPHQAHLERPFDVVIRLVCQVEHRVGPLLVHIAGGGDASDNAGVVLTGVQCLHVDELLPLKAVELPMRFLPLEAGVQAVGSGMVVTDELEGKVYDTVQAPNIYVCR